MGFEEPAHQLSRPGSVNPRGLEMPQNQQTFTIFPGYGIYNLPAETDV